MKIKWIKLETEMFDNRKIKYIRTLKNGNEKALLWVMLLTLSGKSNSKGALLLTDNMPYTPQTLASEVQFDVAIVEEALKEFESLNMIGILDDTIYIANWEEYQNVEGMEKVRAQTNRRVSNYRKRQKEKCNVTSSVTVTGCNAIEKDIDKDKDIDIEKEKEKDKEKEKIDYEQIKNLFNTLCPSYPTIKTLSSNRKKELKARFKCYSMEDIEILFKKAEASSFLKGSNDRGWSATFDWLIKEQNMLKVIEGNYDDKKGKGEPQHYNENDDISDLF